MSLETEKRTVKATDKNKKQSDSKLTIPISKLNKNTQISIELGVKALEIASKKERSSPSTK